MAPIIKSGVGTEMPCRSKRPRLSKLLRTLLVEWQNLDIVEHFGDLLEQGSRVIDMVGSCVQFSENNRRNEQPSTVLDESMG